MSSAGSAKNAPSPSYRSRGRIRRWLASLTSLALLAGLLTVVPPMASAAPGVADVRRQASSRADVVRLVKTGSPGLARAAEAALLGTDQELQQFLATGQFEAAESDDRVRIAEFLSMGGTATRTAAGEALSGTPQDVRSFLATGWRDDLAE